MRRDFADRSDVEAEANLRISWRGRTSLPAAIRSSRNLYKSLESGIRRILFATLLLLAPSLHAKDTLPYFLKERFQKAHSGDYVVTLQNNTYSILLIRLITAETLILEEISAPKEQINDQQQDWRAWLQNKAPGHTAWTLYEIDLKSGQLIECFSHSKKGWILLDSAEQVFAKLLTLPLKPLKIEKRRRIGPPPAAGETDHRALWNPALTIEGKRIRSRNFDVFRTRWPDDSSPLSLCPIELYFDHDHPTFPFPYWIEVQSPHYNFKVSIVDSGHALSSPLPGSVPKRPPQLLGHVKKGKQLWSLKLRAPTYYPEFHLYVLDLSSESRVALPIAHALKREPERETVSLDIPLETLQQVLQSGHQYRWMIIPPNAPDSYTESDETFTWE